MYLRLLGTFPDWASPLQSGTRKPLNRINIDDYGLGAYWARFPDWAPPLQSGTRAPLNRIKIDDLRPGRFLGQIP